ncbi:hypothetical protein [Lactobacillus taiwanensis]|mgnify:CR=1 FL=1|uniref:hypothetical protein n=1 Tax=Lactobacillus taiwanensis TaxID=508451 RepID=UPI00129E45EA|nr:hypothetical protein [Lactobacillus taiwanensis]MRM99413.1 hypothetical protein [Lactobacillus taiwanensis]
MGTVIFVCIGIVLLGFAIYYIGAFVLGLAIIGLMIYFPLWVIDDGYNIILGILGIAILALTVYMIIGKHK